MNANKKGQCTEDPQALRKMLLRLQDEAYTRIRDLRRDQEQESESDPR
jgi:hypothetical protein